MLSLAGLVQGALLSLQHRVNEQQMAMEALQKLLGAGCALSVGQIRLAGLKSETEADAKPQSLMRRCSWRDCRPLMLQSLTVVTQRLLRGTPRRDPFLLNYLYLKT